MGIPAQIVGESLREEACLRPRTAGAASWGAAGHRVDRAPRPGHFKVGVCEREHAAVCVSIGGVVYRDRVGKFCRGVARVRTAVPVPPRRYPDDPSLPLARAGAFRCVRA